MTDRIGLLAPWLTSHNVGDQVIGDAVVSELAAIGIHPTHEFGTHRRSPWRHLRGLRGVGPLIVGGTSILHPKMERWWPFWLTPDLAALYRRRLILMGVGWSRSGIPTSAYTRWVLREVLDPEAVHSVRDSHTAERLAEMGIHSVVTGCPSTWRLPPWRPADTGPAQRVLMTVTDYGQDIARDLRWIARVREQGVPVSFQPMSLRDNAYLQQGLGVRSHELLVPRLSALDEVLAQPGSVMVGTRLHGGIRAMQHGRCAVIFALDVRAREMVKDARLPVVGFDDEDAYLAPVRGVRVGSEPQEAMTDSLHQAVSRFLGQFEERLAD